MASNAFDTVLGVQETSVLADAVTVLVTSLIVGEDGILVSASCALGCELASAVTAGLVAVVAGQR